MHNNNNPKNADSILTKHIFNLNQFIFTYVK